MSNDREQRERRCRMEVVTPVVIPGEQHMMKIARQKEIG